MNPTFYVMYARDRDGPLVGQGGPRCPLLEPEGTIQPRQLWTAQTEGTVMKSRSLGPGKTTCVLAGVFAVWKTT